MRVRVRVRVRERVRVRVTSYRISETNFVLSLLGCIVLAMNSWFDVLLPTTEGALHVLSRGFVP